MAITLTPKVAALVEHGAQLMRVGQFNEAARVLERALQQMPQVPELQGMHAEALLRAEKLDAALGAAQRALRLRPGWGEALMLRGNVEARLERFAEAEGSFREAMRAFGAAPALQANLGSVLLELGRFDEALAAFEAALRSLDDTGLHAGKAKALYGLGRRDESATSWRAVLAREPESLEALEQLLQIYMGERRLDELEEVCARGAALAPHDATFQLGVAFATWQRGRHDEAIELYRAASRIAQAAGDSSRYREANMNEAMCLLKLGRWAEGWERYRGRLDRDALRQRYPQIAADPAQIAAAPSPLRIRVHHEQGIGDELFFLRFAPYLRAAGHRLSYRTEPKLVALLEDRRELFDGVGVEQAPDPLACDVELLASDLALASGHEFAPPLPLAADPARREAAAARLRAFGPPPYVGVTWAAGLTPEERKDLQKTTPVWIKRISVMELGRILRPLRATIVVLQRKPDPAETAAFYEALGRAALDASDVNEDLRDALALLACLDDYVGMSNTNMHLLAGLGAPKARVLVQSPAEWRWSMAGRESPWFPGFVLYRQGADRSWNEAYRQLSADLEKAYASAT
jgi:tetratricopeptide (TPR) repeat protein